jgi:hypothetical protein
MPSIYLHRDPVDFRKSFRGLAAIVERGSHAGSLAAPAMGTQLDLLR